jgi:hypothetical protein
MLSVLVMTVCTTAGGVNYCQPIVLSPIVPRHECYALSQPVMAKWLGEHPAYTLKRFDCADPRQVQNLLGRGQA